MVGVNTYSSRRARTPCDRLSLPASKRLICNHFAHAARTRLELVLRGRHLLSNTAEPEARRIACRQPIPKNAGGGGASRTPPRDGRDRASIVLFGLVLASAAQLQHLETMSSVPITAFQIYLIVSICSLTTLAALDLVSIIRTDAFGVLKRALQQKMALPISPSLLVVLFFIATSVALAQICSLIGLFLTNGDVLCAVLFRCSVTLYVWSKAFMYVFLFIKALVVKRALKGEELTRLRNLLALAIGSIPLTFGIAAPFLLYGEIHVFPGHGNICSPAVIPEANQAWIPICACLVVADLSISLLALYLFVVPLHQHVVLMREVLADQESASAKLVKAIRQSVVSGGLLLFVGFAAVAIFLILMALGSQTSDDESKAKYGVVALWCATFENLLSGVIAHTMTNVWMPSKLVKYIAWTSRSKSTQDTQPARSLPIVVPETQTSNDGGVSASNSLNS